MVHIKTEPLDIKFEPSRMYSYIRCRQLEGTFPGSPTTGTWISTRMRIEKGWGVLEESLWPYDGDANHWPPSEPPGLDLQAKAKKILAYQRISTVDECRKTLASEYFILATFNTDDSWNQAQNGIIPISKNRVITGSHTVSLVGYDDDKQIFIFLNSWGINWGDGGYGYLPYSYFTDRFLEGWSKIALDIPRPEPIKPPGIHEYLWAIESLLGYPLHCVEFIDTIQDEMIAWGFAIEHYDFLDLEELFVRPNWRRHGYATKMASEFNQLSLRLGKQLRAFIPHSDNEIINYPGLKATLRHLHLSLEPSPVKWCGKVGI